MLPLLRHQTTTPRRICHHHRVGPAFPRDRMSMLCDMVMAWGESGAGNEARRWRLETLVCLRTWSYLQIRDEVLVGQRPAISLA
jgi:hypothetical protein